MARDREGDDSKRTSECRQVGVNRCPNMKETGGGFEGEQYDCEVCGASYYLDYDDMR